MRSKSLSLAVLPAIVLLTSCNSTQIGVKTTHIQIQGRAMGGEQPITAATIQLYAVGTTTDGGAATPLINQTTTPVTTSDGTGLTNSNANAGNNNNQFGAGYFTITGDYTCPSASSEVYIASIYGNPGGGTNSVQEEIAALGQCGNLSSSTNVTINEVTTVGTVRALYGYITAYDHVGSTPAHATALSTAFSLANEYVNFNYGIAPGAGLPTGYNASDNELRALANVVQSCTNSTGSTSTGQPCGTFFGYAQGTASTVPGDTITALVDIFASPTNNVTSLFNLQPTTPAFTPTNVSAPADWTLPIIVVPNTPTFSPNGGSYTSVQSVTISVSNADGNTAIYYTTNGSTPSATNGTLYTGPVSVSSSSETLKAVAIEESRLSSSVATSNSFSVTGLSSPTVSVSSVTASFASTTGQTITATSNVNGSLVTFGTAGSVGGSYSPTTCTIAAGTCSVSYIPSGTTSPGTYNNDLTASFGAYGTYNTGTASNTLTIGEETETWLYSFSGGTTNGSQPDPAPVQATDGNFYGTTQGGGANGYGIIFELTPNGSSTPTFTLIHSFTGTDGKYPTGGLTVGTDGNLWGTTQNGGANNQGTIFKLTPNGTSSTLTLLYSFSDGGNPVSTLVEGADGNFYGTEQQGGVNGYGSIFQWNPTSSTYTSMHSFSASVDGYWPQGRLVQGTDGYFYGTTYYDGPNGGGTVFQVIPNVSSLASSTVNVVGSFYGTGNGPGNPYNGVVFGADGNLYGTGPYAGSTSYGAVFSIAPVSNSTPTVLYTFYTGSTQNDGVRPLGSVILGSDGKFYGTTYQGGNSGNGTVYQLTPNGTSSKVDILYTFAGGTDASGPRAGLVQGSDGNFYGSGTSGGANNLGAIFRITSNTTLSGPVTISAPSSVQAGASFSLNYSVANGYGDTMKRCAAGVLSSANAYTQLAVLSGSPTTQMASLTAPSTAGTYTLSVVCGGTESATSTLTVTPATPAATPTFSPRADGYLSSQSVTLSDSTTGSTIYYTSDGATPVIGNADTFQYNGTAITVSSTKTLNAIAVASGYSTSATGTAAYSIGAPSTLGNQAGFVGVGSSSLFTAKVIITTAGTLGSISVNTQGATNLDYAANSPQAGSCTTGLAYPVGEVCTVQYLFTPLYAGNRVGAVVLRDASNNVLGTTLLAGQGQAPQAVVYPGVESIIFGGFSSDVFGEAIDASNNLYVGQGGSILKYPYNSASQTWSSSSTTVVTGPNNGGIGQFGIDGAGNVYLGNGNEVLKATLTPSGSYTVSTIYSGGTSYSSNVDIAGNVFEGNGSTLTEISPTTSGGYTSGTVSGTSFSGLNGLVADYNQNLYLCDSGNSALYKLTYSSGSYAQSTISTGMSNCNGVAVDASGTVYAVDDGTSSHVQRFGTSNSGSSYSLLGTAGSFNRENGVVLDGPGNLYVTDDGGGDYLDHVVVAGAYTFPFGTVAHNSGSASQAFVLTNVGNTSMTFTSAVLSGNTTDFTVISNGCSSTVSTDSTACSVVVKFAPTTTGSKSATLTFTDNSRNVSGTTQIITLSGTGS